MPVFLGASSKLVLIGVLAVSLIVVASMSYRLNVLDDKGWVEVINEVAETGFPSSPTQYPKYSILYSYAYPATTIIYPGALLVVLGVTGDTALKVVLTILLALGIALTVWLCYRLRPESTWWLAVWGLLTWSDFYQSSTPPSSAVIPLVTALFVGTLFARTHGSEFRWPLILLGAIAGVALSTRFDISLLSLALCVIYLRASIGARAWYVPAATLISFALTNPFLYLRTAEYVAATIDRVLLSYTTLTAYYSLYETFVYAPFAVAGLICGFVALCLPRLLLPFSRTYLSLWLGTTAVFFLALALSHFHPTWYFYPFLAVWMVFLPLFIFTLVQKAALTPTIAYLTRERSELALAILIAGGQFLTHFYF